MTAVQPAHLQRRFGEAQATGALGHQRVGGRINASQRRPQRRQRQHHVLRRVPSKPFASELHRNLLTSPAATLAGARHAANGNNNG